MSKLLLISGKARAGKDTTALQLKKAFDSIGHKSTIFHIADYLKFVAAKYYSWSGKKDETGRTLLQTISETAREYDPNFLVNVALSTIRLISCDYDTIIIPDIRYRNEIQVLNNAYECRTFRIERPNYDNGLTAAQASHISEIDLDDYIDWNYIITNDQSIEHLYEVATPIVEEILSSK